MRFGADPVFGMLSAIDLDDQHMFPDEIGDIAADLHSPRPSPIGAKEKSFYCPADTRCRSTLSGFGAFRPSEAR
jgi:hypothetical protein